LAAIDVKDLAGHEAGGLLAMVPTGS
jgi:hypothetical protein